MKKRKKEFWASNTGGTVVSQDYLEGKIRNTQSPSSQSNHSLIAANKYQLNRDIDGRMCDTIDTDVMIGYYIQTSMI